ncbi:MAG: hypothetical protein Q7U36_01955 [bacterium]|nr:hypothetical protein [bacterium]
MQTKIKIAVFLLFVGIFLPIFSASAGIVPCGLSVDDADLAGDQTGACTLCHLIVGIQNIVSFGLKLLITVAAVGIFIAGVMYIISSGSEEMMKNAKAFLTTSLMGFTITLMAWFIVNSVMWILSADPESITDPKATNIERKAWNKFECSTQSSANKPSDLMPCSCANFEVVSSKYTSVGNSTNVIDENACKKNCDQAGATHYKFDDNDYKKLP